LKYRYETIGADRHGTGIMLLNLSGLLCLISPYHLLSTRLFKHMNSNTFQYHVVGLHLVICNQKQWLPVSDKFYIKSAQLLVY